MLDYPSTAVILKPLLFRSQPDVYICLWCWPWCEQGEGGRKVPRRIYWLCQHGEGLGEPIPLVVAL
jgi:hypothetical protein